MSVGAATSGEGEAIEAVVRRADVQMDEADRAHDSSKGSMKRPELCQGEPANKATISASRAVFTFKFQRQVGPHGPDRLQPYYQRIR